MPDSGSGRQDSEGCEANVSPRHAKQCLLARARRLRTTDYCGAVVAYERATKIDFMPEDESLRLTRQALRKLASLHVSRSVVLVRSDVGVHATVKRHLPWHMG
jgi:hypothetical protein